MDDWLQVFQDESTVACQNVKLLNDSMGHRLAALSKMSENGSTFDSVVFIHLARFIIHHCDNVMASKFSLVESENNIPPQYTSLYMVCNFDPCCTIQWLERDFMIHKNKMQISSAREISVNDILSLNLLGKILHILRPNKWSIRCGNIFHTQFMDPLQNYLTAYISLLDSVDNNNNNTSPTFSNNNDDTQEILVSNISNLLKKVQSSWCMGHIPIEVLSQIDTKPLEDVCIQFLQVYHQKCMNLKKMWSSITGRPVTDNYYSKLIKVNGRYKEPKIKDHSEDDDAKDEDEDEGNDGKIELPEKTSYQLFDKDLIPDKIFEAIFYMTLHTYNLDTTTPSTRVSFLSPDFFKRIINIHAPGDISMFEHWFHLSEHSEYDSLSFVLESLVPESNKSKLFGSWSSTALRKILYDREKVPISIGYSYGLIPLDAHVITIPQQNVLDFTLSWVFDTADVSGLPKFSINMLTDCIFKLEGETISDGHGIFKIWFCHLTNEIFSPSLGIWQKQPNNVYIANQSCMKVQGQEKDSIIRRHRIIQLTGLLVVLHNMCGQLFPYYLAPFYMHPNPSISKDKSNFFKVYDEQVAKSIQRIEHATVEELAQFKLVNSSNQVVDSSNLDEFIMEELNTRFCIDYWKHMRQGIILLCNNDKYKYLDIINVLSLTKDLGQFLFGKLCFNFDQVRLTSQCKPRAFGRSSVVTWFWQICDELDDEQLVKLYQFITGSTVFFEKITISKLEISDPNSPTSLLPIADVCLCYLFLPEYGSKALLQTKLLQAINNCSLINLTEQ